MISSSLSSDEMDVEIAGINNNSNHLHHNNNNNATETVYERIKMMLQTYKTTLPNPQYIEEIQQDNGFIPKWRYRTIQYMLTYHEIGLCDETLSLAINIFDRYLSKKSVGKQQIELICVVAMMLASKLIENDGNYFRVEEVVGAVKNTTEKEVCTLELDIIQTLDWELNAVTSVSMMLHFAELTHGLIVDVQEKEKIVLYAKAFLDHGACEYEFLQYSPVVQSVSALLCAYYNANFSCIEWCKRMSLCNICLTEYGLKEEIQSCCKKLLCAFYKYYPTLKMSNLKHNIVVTADGMCWNEYMDMVDEVKMMEEEKESNTRMSVSPTNIMDGIQEQQHVETNNHVQHFQQAVLVGPMQKNESIKGRATSPTNVQQINVVVAQQQQQEQQQKYLCIGGAAQNMNSSIGLKSVTSTTMSAFNTTCNMKNLDGNDQTTMQQMMVVDNVGSTASKKKTTCWMIGGELGNELKYY